MLTRRPKVAANLAPPSYYSTSAIVNRLATPDPNPRSVPRGFGPKFEDLRPGSLHDTDEFVGRDHKTVGSTSGAFRILQREAQLLGQVVDRGALPLPGAVGLEPQRADAAAPRRDHAADGAVVGTIGVVLIDLLDDVRRHAYERAQSGGRLDAVLAAVPRRLEDGRDLLEVVDEELL